MMLVYLEIWLIALFVAINCSLAGVFLVLRSVALMSDAISHALLLGIACMFLVTHNLDSPLLLCGALVAGLATVWATETVIQTERIKKDAAIGLIFPLFFSLGVILISKCARNVHLDTDMVLLGEIAFAPFKRLALGHIDLGPTALWTLAIILIINGLFIGLCYKQLVVSTFDYTYARLSGFWPQRLYYAIMTVVSITAIGSFNIVGSVVVVALMICPTAAALLLSHHLEKVIGLSIIFGMISAMIGCFCAQYFDISFAGSIAASAGGLFSLAFLKHMVAKYMPAWG